jgi:hypothetical protein
VRQGGGLKETYTVPLDYHTALQNELALVNKCVETSGPVVGYVAAKTSINPYEQTATISYGYRRPDSFDTWFVIDLVGHGNSTELHTYTKAGLTSFGHWQDMGRHAMEGANGSNQCFLGGRGGSDS